MFWKNDMKISHTHRHGVEEQVQPVGMPFIRIPCIEKDLHQKGFQKWDAGQEVPAQESEIIYG